MIVKNNISEELSLLKHEVNCEGHQIEELYTDNISKSEPMMINDGTYSAASNSISKKY